MPKFEFKLDQMSFLLSIFSTIALAIGLFTPFQSKIQGSSFFHWLMDRCSTSLLAGLVAMPIPIKSPEYPPHPTLKSTLPTTPDVFALDVPISQRPHPTYAEKSRAVSQSRQASKLRLDALNAPAAVRYRESRRPAVHAIFRRNNEMSDSERKAFQRRREYKYKVWGMRRLSPLRCETKVEYDDLEEPGYYLRHAHTLPVPSDWRSYPAPVPLHSNLRTTRNNGLWGPKRSSLTVEDLAGTSLGFVRFPNWLGSGSST